MVSNDSESASGPEVSASSLPARRPLIGLPTYSERTRFGHWEVDAAVLARTYVDMTERAGGIPVLLPPTGIARPELIERLDGLVLTGGADIDPSRYAAEPDPATLGIRPDRDESEFGLFELARAAKMPVLAICRGLQLVNVAMGGTLLQHLPDALGHTDHARTPGAFGVTTVRTTAGSRVAAIAGQEVKVHCHHHQAIDALAPGLTASAHAPDGTIEAAESDGSFLVGVQWHPEENPADDRLMRALVEQAAQFGRERTR
ncbi:gamma-glutamyl-gamma-aminobutyrate hydrolase family protein [Nocardia sp. SYP-A9097]|uniref:gamma-glutamyl-gamma-aminobutyrate hydrolase family protein n=1 Tax=Nocardia sp. SYP-A9097 TaxID=2663237 RepID=UPI00132487EE|nr:gamma-glutamyl-gamma-aminobutyrate hydrolase family protein [Nocardia sp. SYP-A9097]MRH91796.1 gamma-glutamyl-gamma-aminobutyrate hydrolase family protein [Nocardia sp. SYP-A9097]